MKNEAIPKNPEGQSNGEPGEVRVVAVCGRGHEAEYTVPAWSPDRRWSVPRKSTLCPECGVNARSRVEGALKGLHWQAVRELAETTSAALARLVGELERVPAARLAQTLNALRAQAKER